MNDNHAVQITLAGGLALSVLLAMGAYHTRKAELENSGESRLMKIYASLDISETIQQQIAKDTFDEQQQWTSEWNEGGNATSQLSPIGYAFVMALGYATGLVIVLLNALYLNGPGLQFLYIPLIALAIAGFIKYRIAEQNPFIGTFTVVLSGAVAAISNWLVAGLF